MKENHYLSKNFVRHDRQHDDVDVREIINSLLRHKYLISKIAIITLVVSGIYAFIKKPVWEGQFQIVLEQNDSGRASQLAQLAANNPLLATLSGVGGDMSGQLETEVKVLKSPSILKPTYDFVKDSKLKKGENINSLNFSKWLDDNLIIELAMGTSVLNISYRDTDPDLVLSVLNRISNDYQSYSGRDRRRGLSNGVKYLKTQVKVLIDKSRESMRKAQEYALNNGLGLQDGMPTALGAISTNSESISVEASREAAQNRVNVLYQKIGVSKRCWQPKGLHRSTTGSK